MHVTLVTTTQGVFANIAAALSPYLLQRCGLTVTPRAMLNGTPHDVTVCLNWEAALKTIGSSGGKRIIVCIYDALSWRQTEEGRKRFKTVWANADALIACNARIAADLEESGVDRPIYIIEDGVDLQLFSPLPLPSRVTGGWAGNSNRHTPGGPEDLKGLSIIRRAQQLAQAPINILDSANGRGWKHTAMPSFYADVSYQICASYCEGTPNPLLEAMACGRPVLTTNVGIVPDVVTHGKTGFIVERTPEALADGMQQFATMPADRLRAMGDAARVAVSKWGWDRKARLWAQAFDQVAKEPARRVGAQRKAEPAKAPTEAKVEGPIVAAPPPRVVANPDRPTVLLMSDVRDWAFHQNMSDLEETLEDRFSFKHFFVAELLNGEVEPDFDPYDVLFCVYHRWPIHNLIPWERTVGSLRALWFKPETMTPPDDEDIALVNRFRGFHVVTEQNYRELADTCPNVVYLTNPVNMNRFIDPTPVEGEVIASWSGNAKHITPTGILVKGLYDVAIPGAAAAGVPLNIAEYHTARLAPSQMPAFYDKANLTLCSSLYEGASNSVMEAMAAGHFIVSTPCGNILEMRDAQLAEWGETGIVIVERTPEAFATALKKLKTDPYRIRTGGFINREEIRKRWSWEVWGDRYATFLRMAL